MMSYCNRYITHLCVCIRQHSERRCDLYDMNVENCSQSSGIGERTLQSTCKLALFSPPMRRAGKALRSTTLSVHLDISLNYFHGSLVRSFLFTLLFELINSLYSRFDYFILSILSVTVFALSVSDYIMTVTSFVIYICSIYNDFCTTFLCTRYSLFYLFILCIYWDNDRVFVRLSHIIIYTFIYFVSNCIFRYFFAVHISSHDSFTVPLFFLFVSPLRPVYFLISFAYYHACFARLLCVYYAS